MSTATKKVFSLEQVFAMWKRKAKNGSDYFTGKIGDVEIRGFYNTKKKNPKEPDIRIYKVGSDNKIEKDEFITLWCNATKNGKKILSGKLDGKRVVGFINAKATAENKQPYFSVYWSDDQHEAGKKEEGKDNKNPF